MDLQSPGNSYLQMLAALPDSVIEAVLVRDLTCASLRALLEAARAADHPPLSPAEQAALDAATEAAAQRQCLKHPASLVLRPRSASSAGGGAKHRTESALDVLEFLERLDCCVVQEATTGESTIDPRAQVWSTGRNDAGQGARRGGDVNSLLRTMPLFQFAEPSFGSVPRPTPVAGPAQPSPLLQDTTTTDDAVVAIAAGERHSAALTANGVLLLSGANDNGQLGLGDLVTRNGWVPLNDSNVGNRVAMVACGGRHTVVLTGDGRVLTCGANEHGQLGLDEHASKYSYDMLGVLEQPRRVERFMAVTGIDTLESRWQGGIVQIAAGAAHSVVLLADGRVYCAGDNSRGQLGLHAEVRAQRGFAILDCYGHKVIRIGCGVATTMFLTRDNMVLVTGKRATGLCVIGGLGSSMVTHLTVGDGFALARTNKSDIVVSKCRKRFELAEELRNVYPTGVSAGLGHYALVTEEGGAMACGYNAYGQVGAGEMGLTIEGGLDARMIRPHRVALTPVAIPEGFRARSVAAGAFHTLYLLSPR
jgi:alpha-tubulin suppressor-like RCC1 family protein